MTPPSDKTPRRVAFYSPGWPPEACANGIVTYTDLIRHGLAKLCVDTRVVAARVDPPGDPEVLDAREGRREWSRAEGWGHRALQRVWPAGAGILRDGRELGAALRILRDRWPFDLLEIEESFGIGEWARRMPGFPTVVRLHGPWFLNGGALGLPVDRTFRHRVASEGRFISRAFAVSSSSQDVLDRVRSYYQLELPGAGVIPNPGPVIPPEKRWRLEACDPHKVLFVGRFDRHKGGDLVIEAFREVAALAPEVELLFAGPDRGFYADDGRVWNLDEFLKDRIPDPGARRRVRILGPQTASQIQALRREALITVIASRFEVCPLVALEAIGLGCPLVTSDAGGLLEIVQADRSGLVFPSGSSAALAKGILTLLENPQLAARLGEAAGRRCAEDFSPPAVARSTVDYYAEVLARFRSSPRGPSLSS